MNFSSPEFEGSFNLHIEKKYCILVSSLVKPAADICSGFFGFYCLIQWVYGRKNE